MGADYRWFHAKLWSMNLRALFGTLLILIDCIENMHFLPWKDTIYIILCSFCVELSYFNFPVCFKENYSMFYNVTLKFTWFFIIF